MTSTVSEERIQSILESWGAKGCSVAFVKRRPDGSWTDVIKTSGIRNERGEKVDGNVRPNIVKRRRKTVTEITDKTRFLIASNSKLFTSLATGIALSESGFGLGVDTKIKDVCPEYGLVDGEAARTVTFADALSHRTGLPRHDNYSSNSVSTIEGQVDAASSMTTGLRAS